MIICNNIDEINTKEERQINKQTCRPEEIRDEVGKQYHYIGLLIWYWHLLSFILWLPMKTGQRGSFRRTELYYPFCSLNHLNMPDLYSRV